MKRILCAMAAAAVSSAAFASDFGISVSVGQPGFYGRIDIGSAPPPRLVFAQPILVEPAPPSVVQAPIYLHVPPGHVKHWARNCHRYDACGVPVYFVQDAWYANVYVPYYRRTYAVAAAPVAIAPAPVAYAPPTDRWYVVPLRTVHAVVGPPEQRCWVERQHVVEDRSDLNLPGAIAGAVIGGVLGHQVGGGHGRDIATAGGAVAGAAIGANVGRGAPQVYSEDVERCANVQGHVIPQYWDVTYAFHGVVHHAQLRRPPGRTLTVNAYGEPRG